MACAFNVPVPGCTEPNARAHDTLQVVLEVFASPPTSYYGVYLPRHQAATNDPAAGASVVILMASTAGFAVGDEVDVVSGGAHEVAKITAISADVSITVGTLAGSYALPVVWLYSRRSTSSPAASVAPVALSFAAVVTNVTIGSTVTVMDGSHSERVPVVGVSGADITVAYLRHAYTTPQVRAPYCSTFRPTVYKDILDNGSSGLGLDPDTVGSPPSARPSPAASPASWWAGAVPCGFGVAVGLRAVMQNGSGDWVLRFFCSSLYPGAADPGYPDLTKFEDLPLVSSRSRVCPPNLLFWFEGDTTGSDPGSPYSCGGTGAHLVARVTDSVCVLQPGRYPMVQEGRRDGRRVVTAEACDCPAQTMPPLDCYPTGCTWPPLHALYLTFAGFPADLYVTKNDGTGLRLLNGLSVPVGIGQDNSAGAYGTGSYCRNDSVQRIAWGITGYFLADPAHPSEVTLWPSLGYGAQDTGGYVNQTTDVVVEMALGPCGGAVVGPPCTGATMGVSSGGTGIQLVYCPTSPVTPCDTTDAGAGGWSASGITPNTCSSPTPDPACVASLPCDFTQAFVVNGYRANLDGRSVALGAPFGTPAPVCPTWSPWTGVVTLSP